MKNSVDFFIHKRLLHAWQKDLRYTVAYGGRGSGKSIQEAALVIIFALQNINSRILAVRGTQSKISESSLQILKDVIHMMGLKSYFDMTEHTLKCNNGSEFLFYGAKSYQSFKSLQGIDLVWVDEATELSKDAWETLIPTIREDESRFLIGFNPELESDWVYKEFIKQKRKDAVVVKLNYYDNPYFPTVLKSEMEWDKQTNMKKYLHIWEGELRQVSDGALWSEDLIQYLPDDEAAKLLLTDFGEFEDLVVAIDPSTTDKVTSDACGIIVAGKYKNKEKYLVIDDLTKIMSPNEWADIALQAYDRFSADKIVAEKNQGGDMIKTILRNKRNNIPYKGVHASRGKILRAEPIAALYEQGKVHHLRRFINLEYEMLTYTGEKTQKSPNSLDALVWALTELSNKKIIEPSNRVVADTSNFRF